MGDRRAVPGYKESMVAPPPPNLNDKYLWGGGGANLFFIPRLGSYIFATFDHTEFVAYRSSFQQNFAIGARANAYL